MKILKNFPADTDLATLCLWADNYFARTGLGVVIEERADGTYYAELA